MKCPNCHTKSREDANFCNECGCILELATHLHSGSTASPARFTPKALADEIISYRSSLEGKKKSMTLLFLEVMDYIPLLNKLGQDDFSSVMDGYLNILLKNTHHYKGMVNELTPDRATAMFGMLETRESEAENACHAALAIRNQLEHYRKLIHEKYGFSFQIRMGIDSGPVLIRAIHDDLNIDCVMAEDITCLSKTIENADDSATVVMTQRTYERTGERFRCNSLHQYANHGSLDTIDIYELKGVIYPENGIPERQIFSELVGRDKELKVLERHLAQLLEGDGFIINIMGEPGVGKSRLMAELKKRIDSEDILCLEGRAISIGKNLSFHPIIDTIKNWADIHDNDTTHESAAKLKRKIQRVIPDGADEIFAFVATLMGMRLSGKYSDLVKDIEGDALIQLILKHVRELLINAARIIPLVIITEDLHWADTSSIEFMESLYRLAETQKILFINIFRTGYEQTGQRIVRTIQERYPDHYLQIYLQPLDRRQNEILINNLLSIDKLPDQFREKLLERAGGNPFFTEEIVRSVIDDGSVVIKNGEFQSTDKMNQVVIPQTINDVLLTRIGHLEEKTQSLVKIASVIGRSFFYRILKDVVKSVEDVDMRLGYLKEAQLIHEQKRMDELEFLFKHALTQEVAYESNLHQKRKELHLKVAKSIEQIFNERIHEFYGVLAHHYSKGEDLEKAEEYLIKAGEEALKSSASSEAVNFFMEALKLQFLKHGREGDPERVAALERKIGLAYFFKGEFGKALEYFDRVLGFHRFTFPKTNVGKIYRVVSNLIDLFLNIYLPRIKEKKVPSKKENEIADLLEKKGITLIYLDTKRCIVENLGLFKYVNQFDITRLDNGVRVYFSITGILTWTGISFKMANRVLEITKDRINREDSRELLWYYFNDLFYKVLSGNWKKLSGFNRELLDLNLKKGRSWVTSAYILQHAIIRIEQGLFKEVEELENMLSEIWEVYGYQNAKGLWYHTRIKRLLKTRQLEDAGHMVDKGIRFQNEIGEELRELNFYGLKTMIKVFQMELDEAAGSFKKGNDIFIKKGRVVPYYMSSLCLGKFLLDLKLLENSLADGHSTEILKHRKSARQSGRKSMKISLKFAVDRTEAFRMMGTYFWLVNKQRKALFWWGRSMSVGEDMGATVELARTWQEIGERLDEPKSRYGLFKEKSTEDYLKQAERVFKELGLFYENNKVMRLIPD